jgi:hypothetical protein
VELPPPENVELERHLGIASPVTAKLFSPELCAAGWLAEEIAVMAMPETAVDMYDCAPSFQDQIGLARQIASVEPESEPQTVQGSPDYQFGTRIPIPYAGHHRTAPVRRYDVSQRKSRASFRLPLPRSPS